MSRHRIASSTIVLLSLLLSAQQPRLRAETTIEVSTTVDDVVVNGNCTLREAIIAANTDAAVDACPAGSGADTIVLPAGAYLLSLAGPGEDASRSGDLDIAGHVTIRGAGSNATLVQPKRFPLELSDRVIHVLSGGDLTLQGVTIRGGVCAGGAGLLNEGRLVIVDSHVRDNVAEEFADWCGGGWGGAGIYNNGELVVTRSSVSANRVLFDGSPSVEYPGGGLLNYGSADISQSVLSGNYAASGGGISNFGGLQAVDTVVSHNGARFYGGGLDNNGNASLTRATVLGNADGGILNGWLRPSALSLVNCTVSGNWNYRLRGGSIFNAPSGTVVATSSTVAGNFSVMPGAGVAGSTELVQLVNTIVANGSQGDCTGPVMSLGNNLDSDGSCGLIAQGDLSGVDPLLGPLADNGGPTPTHALVAGSPAIDHIPLADCAVATDQRGVARPQPSWGGCDIGAYEASPTADIGPVIEVVKALYREGVLTKAQELALLQLLKPALFAATTGDEQTACTALSDFTEIVSGYVRDGTLPADAAQPLLDAGSLAISIVCH